jgi:dolichol-phosphate mannosyltransferase
MSDVAYHELTVVMPVYNEQECIVGVVRSWLEELSRLGIDFTIIVLNDGSTDGTKEELSQFGEDQRLCIIDKQNSGHGPTILMGYARAVQLSEWVFQVDSDDEISPGCFYDLWSRRHAYDALFAVRTSRRQGVGRRIISAVSRFTVSLIFGKGVEDVNTPYRLIRSLLLMDLLVGVPVDTFAPNILISGMLVQTHARILNFSVPHTGRKTGATSIVRYKLWRAALRSFVQTIVFAVQIRMRSGMK